MLNLIENSGLLIADVSNPNINVYHELGYLMGLNRAKGLASNNFILVSHENIKSDLVGFNIQPYQRIRFKDHYDLKSRLIDSLLVHYGINQPDNG